jgi:hypothetical protein
VCVCVCERERERGGGGEHGTVARYFVTVSAAAVAEVLSCKKTESSVKLEPLVCPCS